MLHKAIIILIGFLLSFMLGSGFTLNAQDTAEEHVLEVDWQDEDGNIEYNALRNAILADTTDAGERPAHPERVYKLQAGGFYWNTNRIDVDFDLRLIGEEADEDTHPPVVQPVHDEEGDFDETAILVNGDAEFRNFWFLGMSPEGNMGWNPIQFHADDAEIILDNMIIEYNWSPVIDSRGHGSTLKITNSHFRNLIYHEQYWAGRGAATKGDHEEVIIENNTFFNVQGTIFQDQTNDESLWFNHNTIVNVGRGLFFGKDQMTDGFVTNNLVINGFWHGETYLEDFDDVRHGEEDNQYAGLVEIDHLDPQFGFEEDRTIGILNNATWRDKALYDYYEAYNDTATTEWGIRAQPFLNQRALNKVNEFDNIRFEGTIEGVYPEFENYPDNADDLVAWMDAWRTGADELPIYWWDADGRNFEDPEQMAPTLSASWPLPENFTYSNEELLSAATGDYPVGDLNWFPQEKESWEAERDQLEEQIREGFEVIEFRSMAEYEAQDGELSGDENEVFVVDDDAFAYFEYDGGTISWDFEMEEGGDYDVAVNYRNRWDSDGRANDLYVNDEEIAHMEHPNSGGDWLFHEVEGVSFDEGANTLEIRESWGFIDYANVEIRDNDEVVADLGVWEAEPDGNISIVCDDDQGCASGGQYVEFVQNAEGGITWQVDDLEFNGREDGEFRFNIRYRTPEGAVQQDLYLNGEPAIENIEFDEDSWEVLPTDLTYLEDGLQSIELRSNQGNIHVDNVQVFGREGHVTTIEPEDELAREYELKQNYPNPFNPTTNIEFRIPEASDVTLEVYNVLGQRVATLVDDQYSAGTHTVQFDASGLASGMYIYRLEAGAHQMSKQMMFIK